MSVSSIERLLQLVDLWRGNTTHHAAEQERPDVVEAWAPDAGRSSCRRIRPT
jgi:hypothetical protein